MQESAIYIHAADSFANVVKNNKKNKLREEKCKEDAAGPQAGIRRRRSF